MNESDRDFWEVHERLVREKEAAARQPAPVVGEGPSDEDLLQIYREGRYAAMRERPGRIVSPEGTEPFDLAGIRALRDAILAAQAVQRVPEWVQIPEGWKVQSVYPLAHPEGHLLAWLITTGPNYKEALGSGPEWHDALRDAIEQAKDRQG